MNSDRLARIPPPTKRLVVRKANSHRDLRPLTERATLEKVLGLTVSKNAALACDPVSGIIAYPAGCVVVLFNPRKNKQSFVLNTSRKTITSVAFSGDGKYLATGESGHMPSVRVWDMEDPSHPQIAEMTKGHKFGVACVAFSPNLKYVASVGFQHDMIVNIWNWKTSTKVASNKVSSKVSALSFSENGSYFVTVGIRHVKFWYFDTESNKSKVSKTLVINGRAALLGEQRNNTFYDVACGRGLNSDITYCVTSSGLLCSINSKRVLDTWVELKTSKAHALAVSEHYIVCGCADGIIRVFNPLKLQHIVTLPKPHFLGVNIAEGIDFSNPLSKPEKASYPDTVAVALDTVNHKLTCVYNDHSLYTWDMNDMKRIGKTWSSLYHSACVWGIEVYPSVSDNRQAALPPGSFLTCSADDTIRVWNIEEGTSVLFERNVYSKEMMKIIYTDDTVANLKDTDVSPAIKNMRDSNSDSHSAGVRCLRISPDGQTLATGDRSGNVRVYDLMFFDETAKIEAHESEVLCVEFSPNDSSGHKLLASAGRDRLIHIFDMQNNFSFVQTLDDHSASITSIKFNLSESDELQLLSCGADKSVIFRTAQQNPELQFVRSTNHVGKTTFYDMDIDVSRKYAATACQDRNVRVYDVSNGKQTRSYKGTPGDDGTLVRITLDSSGTYAATSCSDKSVCVTEFDTGECVASMSGHSEVVTGIKFSVDCKNLISVGGDGCIFVWKIPTTYTQNMVEKLQALGHEPEITLQFGTPVRRDTYQVSHPCIPEESEISLAEPSAFSRPIREPSPPVNYRFSVGQLPSWAKKQLMADGSDKTNSSPEQDNGQQAAQPGGRWAQRIQNGGIHVAGDNGTLQPIAFPFDAADRKRYTIEPISLQEQVRALANSPLERRCSLTRGEDDDLFPADGRAAFDRLTEDDMEAEGTSEAPPGVTVSRGSDVTMHPPRKSSVVTSETGELKFEEAEEVEELKEGEMKEMIIYLPPSQDDFDSEVASCISSPSRRHWKYVPIFRKSQKSNAPRVQEIVHHYEVLQLNHHASLPNIAQPISNGVQEDSSPDEPVEPVSTDTPRRKNSPAALYRSPSADYLPSRVQNFLRAFQLSAAQQPKRLSLTVEDSKGEEQEENDKFKSGEKERITPFSEDSEDEVTSPSEETSKPFGEDENKPEGGEDEEVVGRYFETLGTSSPSSKLDEQVKEPPPLDTEKLLRTRLSISARFLSRSHQPGRIGSLPPNAEEETSHGGNSTSDDFQRRKEEMALAVEATRKRLEALGWKAKEDILKKLPTSGTTTPTTSTSAAASTVHVTTLAITVSSTPTTAVTTVSSVSKEAENTPVSSLTDSNNKPSVITNLLETRLAEVQDTKGTKNEDKEQSVKKVVASDKKENESKDEDGEKTKRSASHLISFFSQSKSSKNKDKDKENTKEKEKSKSKDKEKGRSTPPPGKQTSEGKSTLGGKLERKGSTASTSSQKSEGKSWRKSLGILGGGSKHDKEEKHKKSTDYRASTPSDLSVKHSPAVPHKEESNALRTVKESKDEKSNRKQPERRNSNPTAELLKKNSKAAPTAQDSSALKTAIENKDEKASKKQPERGGSTPITDSQTQNTHASSSEQDESSLKTLKEETKGEKLTKEQNARLSSVEPQTKSSHPGSSKHDEHSSQKTVKTEGKGSKKTEPNSQTRRTNDNGSSFSENTVQLREKKGRLTGDERREKAKSLGDISSKLHTVEVSILDPTVPPSRTVDTMDIPDQLARHAKRPMSSNAVLETPPLAAKNKPLERKLLDTKDDTLNDHNGVRSDSDTLKNSSSRVERVLDEKSSEHKAALDTKSAPSFEGSGKERMLAPGPGVEKKVSDQEINKVGSPAKPSRSGSGSSLMPDISELSAELSAAIASPPPQPIRLSMSESNLRSSGPPLSSRRTPIGKDQDSASAKAVDQDTCQETLENLVKAFQNVMDLHSKVLNEEPTEDSHRLLSYISSAFSAIEEQIHESRVRRRQWELSSLPRGNPGAGSRPLGGMLSMSTGNLDQIGSKGYPLRRHSELSISAIPEVEVEVHEVLLEKYSDRLLEMVAQKLRK